MIYQIISKHIWRQVVNSWVLDRSGIYFKTNLELTSSITLLWFGPQQQRNWVLATNSDFLIPISLQPAVVDLSYFRLSISNTLILKYQRFTSSVWKYIRIRKVELVAKNQFLCVINNISSVVVYIVYIFLIRFQLQNRFIRFYSIDPVRLV